MPATRHCHCTRAQAGAYRRLFALYLLGPELMLHEVARSSCYEPVRGALADAPDKFAQGDLPLLDRGYDMCARSCPPSHGVHWALVSINLHGELVPAQIPATFSRYSSIGWSCLVSVAMRGGMACETELELAGRIGFACV